MKKLLLLIISLFVVGAAGAAENAEEQNPPKRPFIFVMRPSKEQQKIFKQRNKQINQLTKQYRKAKSSEKKAAIKVQLTQLVSQATDESMAWARLQVEAEKENLAHMEAKLNEREKKLDEIKAARVEEILSGQAEQRFKLAKKRWKKEMKDAQKAMK